jgi:hypothetical protein
VYKKRQMMLIGKMAGPLGINTGQLHLQLPGNEWLKIEIDSVP